MARVERDADDKRAEIMEDVDSATAPGKMTWQEAKAFLEEMVTDLEARIEALKEENEETEDGN